jgi:hypothetical protein
VHDFDQDANGPCGAYYDYYPCPPYPDDSGSINLLPDSGKSDAHKGGAEGGARDALDDVEADGPIDAASEASEDAADAHIPLDAGDGG